VRTVEDIADARWLQPVRFLQRVLAVGVIAVCLVPAPIAGQGITSASVRGRVVAPDSGPVEGALVELVGRGDSVRTAGTGAFALQGVPVGPATLRISAVGYRPKDYAIDVSRDFGWTGTIVLDRVAHRLAEVQVAGAPPDFSDMPKYADFFRRRRLGFGTLRTHEEIERMGAPDIVSALRGIPGVQVSSTMNPYGEPEVRFRVARCPGQPPSLDIYIDAKRVALFRGSENRGSELSTAFRPRGNASSCADCVRIGELLSSVPLGEVVAVEFYRGPSEIPSDLERGDACAALVIWTR
jgi:hypothetical protein